SLQIIYNQLSRVIKDVRRPEKTFKIGNWISEDQNMKFPTNKSVERQ
ncbi:15153_t:CDS:1, partial [Cetraspora pellucida]